MGGRFGRFGATATAVLVVTTGVVACGGKSEQAEAQDLVLAATAQTYEAATAQVLLTIGDEESEGQVDFENGQSEVAATVDGDDTTVFVDGSDVLVQVGDVVTVVDPDELDVLGALQHLLIAMAPGALVQLMQGLEGDVEILDDEEIDGVSASHYSFHVDTEAVLDSLDGDLRDLMELLLAALGQDGLDVEVWIDDDGRLVQFQAEFDLGEDEPTRVVVGLRDFGSDVDIEIPAASAAVSAEEFGLATADLAGSGWSGSTEIVSTSLPAWYHVGPLNEELTFEMRCRPDGSCRNRDTGSQWDPAGPGTWTIVFDDVGDCQNTETGEVTTPGGYHEHAVNTWTVTAYEDGMATAMEATGEIEGEITPAGRAEDCTMNGVPGGPTSATAEIAGTATRG